MLRYLYYLLFFVIPPLAVCSVVIYKSISDISFNDPDPIVIGDLTLPTHNEHKLTAVVLLGNKGTEISDFLIPYQLLSETGEFNVYTVANHKILSPLNGGVDIYPHYTLNEIDDLLYVPPDLVVIPNIPNIKAPDDKPIIEWIRNHNSSKTIFLSVCEGARTLAETGLIDYKKATTHWSAIGQLRRAFPATHWIDGKKYVEDGNIVSTPGVVTGSMEGTIYVISKLLGKGKAEELSVKLGYKSSESLSIKPINIEISDAVWLLTSLYPWEKKNIGIYINDGVEEISLAALLDTYPRSFTAVTKIFSDKRKIIRSRNNLFLVAKLTKDNIGHTDRLIDIDSFYNNTFPFDYTIRDLASGENRAIAVTVAKTLDYRIDHLKLEGNGWPYRLVAGPLILGMLGILSAYLFERRYLNG